MIREIPRRVGPLRSRTVLLLELGLLALATAAALYFTLASPGAPPVQAFVPSALGAQPPRAVVLAREDGKLAVALAVQPRKSKLLLVATVLGQDGTGAAGLKSSFSVTTTGGRTATADGTACSPGCYEATIAAGGRPTRASVTLGGGKRISFALPEQWPPRPGKAVVRKAEAEYKRLKTLVTHERLASDPSTVAVTTYWAIAPDKLRIETRGGIESIVIGKKRWNRQPGGPWKRTTQSGTIRPIAPYWGGQAQDATVLGSVSVRGHASWKVSFAAPQFPAFFTIWVDKRTHRTLELRMTASAHFMHHVYGPFDAPLEIRPPGSGS